MKKILICLALAATVELVGCSSPHNITIADFVGTWTATKWTETELPPGGSQVVDVLKAGGSWQVTVNPDGTYTATVNNGN